MKVLVISHMYPSTISESQGIVVFQLVRELQKLGCEVRVISPVPLTPFPLKYLSGKWRAYSQVPRRMIWRGTEVYYPRYLTFPRGLFLATSGKRMYSGIREMVQELQQDFKFDIIHAHFTLPDGFAAMLIGAKHKKPLVITPQGTDIDITMSRSRKCFDTVCGVLRNSDMLIAPSAQIKAKLQEKMGIITETIPYGIYEDDIFTGKSDLQQKYSGRIILLSASLLIPTKGLDLNIKAVARIKKKYPSIHYLIAGQGKLKHQLTKLVYDLNIQDSVEFLGQLPHDKLMEYMSICQIFSLPSWQETMGLVYLEAMAHGKPIIGCQGQGVDGLIINGETGLVAKPKDVESLVQAMDFLLGNPDKASEIGEQARKLVLEKYTWEKNAQRHIEIYKELLTYER